MNNERLTENFNLSEYAGTKTLTDYQLQLVRIHAGQLQKVRDYAQNFKKNLSLPVCVKIPSGVRDLDDYNRLVAKGRHPSKTSDHFCGLQQSCRPTLGAADTVYTNLSVNLRSFAARIIEELDKKGLVHFGQIIYETNPATGYEWIHLGNDPKLVFVSGISVPRRRYLMSLDDGKTYVPFSEV